MEEKSTNTLSENENSNLNKEKETKEIENTDDDDDDVKNNKEIDKNENKEKEEVPVTKKRKIEEIEKENISTTENTVSDDQKKEWVYIDDSKQERGPFSFAEMGAWWMGGMLPNTLHVKKQGENDYTQISLRQEFQQLTQYYYSLNYPGYFGACSGNGVSGADITTTGYGADGVAAQGSYPTVGAPGSVGPSSGENGNVYADTGADASGHYAGFDSEYIHPSNTNYSVTTAVGAAPMMSDDDRVAAALLAQDYSQTAGFNVRTGRFQTNKGGWGDPASRQMGHYFDYDSWQQQCQANANKKPKLTKKMIKHFKEKKKLKKKRIPDYLKGD